MTREEAIKVLQREKDCVQQAIQKGTDGDGYVSPDGLIRADDYVEACTVAISALRQQETVTDRHELTNAQKIRAMSDEELASLIMGIHDYPCDEKMPAGECDEKCEKCILEWLQQPAGEEDDHA